MGEGRERGYGLAELMVSLAMIGVVALVGTPTLVNYWQASTLQAGAQELVTVINRGRQLAIAQNSAVCVAVSGGGVRFLVGGCASSTIWRGAGTDGNGVVRLGSGLTVQGSAGATFTNLGAAASPVTYTVIHPATGRTLGVAVASSGQVTVQ